MGIISTKVNNEDKVSTEANFATLQNEGSRSIKRLIEFYNLDVIISVGYRVKSKQGTQFRIWTPQFWNYFKR